MIICHCVQVTEESIRLAIQQGALVEDLKRELMVLCTCGVCAQDIRRIFEEEGVLYSEDWSIISDIRGELSV